MKTLIDRFWTKVKKTDGCWLWTASKNSNGYGYIRINNPRRKALAHRIAWELTNGLVPSGKMVCHRCDVRHCVRPGHLFLATQKENCLDAARKGKYNHERNKGETNGAAKLTIAQVLAIRSLPGSQTAIAKHFGIKQAQVCRIKLRESWSHVT